MSRLAPREGVLSLLVILGIPLLLAILAVLPGVPPGLSVALFLIAFTWFGLGLLLGTPAITGET